MKTRKLIVLLVMIGALLPLCANASAEPWWKNPKGIHLNWKPFTALPKIKPTENWNYHWQIQERTGDGIPKFFATAISLDESQLFVANSSTTPVFTEIDTSPIGSYSIYSTAMTRWNKPYDELFFGTNDGLLRLDEDSGVLVYEWPWGWDVLYSITSIGNGIYGVVSSWGSQSGYHVFKPDGTHLFKKGTSWEGGGDIWGDPISHRYGNDSEYYCKVVPSGGKSILLKMDDDKTAYSFDGGIKFSSPVGVRKDRKEFCYYNDFYCYTDSVVILKPVNLSQGGLIIGKLGGYFYPIPIQCKDLDTFFYSPSTHLMIAGSVGTNQLYSAVLPGPKEIWFPELKIKKTLTKTVLSWDAKQNPLSLEVSTNKVSWKKVTAKKVTKHGTTKVTVPNSKKRLYYRLNYP